MRPNDAAMMPLSARRERRCAPTTDNPGDIRSANLDGSNQQVLVMFVLALTDQPDLVAQLEQLTPLRRLAEVEDVTGPVLFLASSASAMVTGHILPVDGRMLAQ